MRKRLLPIFLSAMMIVGATGYNGSTKVSADEPHILSEETAETSDDEWWKKGETSETSVTYDDDDETEVYDDEIDFDEEAADVASPDEPTASPSDSDQMIDADEEDSAPIDSEDDVAAAEWYKNYEYKLSGKKIILKKYIGTNPKVFVHKSAEINGKKYLTTIQGGSGDGFSTVSPWGYNSSKTEVVSITFQDGFIFPENCMGLFASCGKLESLDLTGVDTSKVRDMSWMFGFCSSLKEVDFKSFNTENVTNMYAMFAYTGLERVDLRSFNTRNVISMERMFSNSYDLKYVNLSSFDTKNVEVATCMFSECNNLKTVDLSSFDFSGLSGKSTTGPLENMFQGCENLGKIYTPKNLKYEMNLPYTMYDPKGKAFNTLPLNTAHNKKLIRNYTGWSKLEDGYHYIKKGEPYTGKTSILGKGYINGKLGWYVATKGKYDKSFVGIAKMHGGGWKFAKNGKLDTSFSGVAQATNGIWYYVNKGVIDRTFSGKLALATNGRWYYISKGKPTKKFTGKIAQTTDGQWYYCTDGRPDMNFSGKIAYCTNGSWYYVTKGKIDRSFTGIATATNGNKYYVINGLLDKTFSGKVTYKGKTYNIVKGAVK